MFFMWNGAGARLEILSIREKKDYKFLRSSQIRLNDIFASRNSLNIFRIYFPIVLFKKSHCKTGCLLELKRGLSIAYPIIALRKWSSRMVVVFLCYMKKGRFGLKVSGFLWFSYKSNEPLVCFGFMRCWKVAFNRIMGRRSGIVIVQRGIMAELTTCIFTGTVHCSSQSRKLYNCLILLLCGCGRPQ